jgi:hypothetical protein
MVVERHYCPYCGREMRFQDTMPCDDVPAGMTPDGRKLESQRRRTLAHLFEQETRTVCRSVTRRDASPWPGFSRLLIQSFRGRGQEGLWPPGRQCRSSIDFARHSASTVRLSKPRVTWYRLSERDDAVSILVLSVLYLWNCHVFSAQGDQALFVSHDEWRWVAVRGAGLLEPANQLLEQFGVLTAAGPTT